MSTQDKVFELKQKINAGHAPKLHGHRVTNAWTDGRRVVLFIMGREPMNINRR